MLLLRAGNRPQGVIQVAVFEQVPQPKGKAWGKLRLAPCSFLLFNYKCFYLQGKISPAFASTISGLSLELLSISGVVSPLITSTESTPAFSPLLISV